jgi:hypothetical protein
MAAFVHLDALQHRTDSRVFSGLFLTLAVLADAFAFVILVFTKMGG